MTLNLFTKIKLFHTNFRRTHENIYGFIYRIYMIVAIMCLLVGSDYFRGGHGFRTPREAGDMFFTGAWYVLITIFILPTVKGLTNWKKYLFPGTYQSITNESTIEILNTEEFINPIPILEEREKKHKFLESENYFCFSGQLIPKREIEKIEFNYRLWTKPYNRYYSYNIILKNGSVIKNIYGELDSTASKYKDNPITDYLKNYC